MKSLLLVLLVTGGILVPGVAGAQAVADLIKAKNCMTCHDLDKKKVGPAFKDVAVKYKDNKDAEAKLIAQLKEGKGHPVKIVATDAELKTLVDYVLSLK
jgi:cytochrome c